MNNAHDNQGGRITGEANVTGTTGPEGVRPDVGVGGLRVGPGGAALAVGPTTNEMVLFWASFLTLIAAGIGFSVRGVDILKDWGNQFGFTQAELGTITGGGLIGFGLAIIFFSFCADRFGYGKLMLVAFLLHASSAVVTFAATPVYGTYGKEGAFWCLNAGMWLFALGNGTCEAVINPLTATLFPRNKTHWLNILHAGWPLGLILGAVIMLGFDQIGGAIRWEYKLGVFLLPVLAYGILMFNRPFPKSEARTAGVPLTGMMKQVGMLGFTLGAALIGLAFAELLHTLLGAPNWTGWIAFGVVWLAFGYMTNFGLGSWVLAFLYLMHALVGYVELGTDSWITNITEQVLKSGTNAKLVFIWTNVLMFTLRFFAGPIVHKINPVGLLFASACLGTVGLYLLGQGFTDSVWPWVAAVTIYGLGKTFYWPTLLGVISERFPKGGALALGLSGGVGMIGAGILGGPGIGYKQDYFAVAKLEETPEGKATYTRYMAKTEQGQPETTPFPLVTAIFPSEVPSVAGIDNAKRKVFEDYAGNIKKVWAAEKAETPADKVPLVLADKAVLGDQPKLTREVELLDEGQTVKVKVTFVSQKAYDALAEKAKKEGKAPPPLLETTLQSDLATLQKEKAAGKPVEANLETTLTRRMEWWDTEGQPNFSRDQGPLVTSQLYGAKNALLYTAYVPAALALGFLFLLVYFAFTGGYKQVHLEEEPPMGEY
jgi:MFS family permease